MPFFSSLSEGLKSAAAKATNAATSTYNDLVALPTTVTCSNSQCKTVLAVPPAFWTWTCENGHEQQTYNKTCSESECGATRELPEVPKIKCSKCGTDATIPTSNASNYLHVATVMTRDTAIGLGETTKSAFTELVSRPKTLPCPVRECSEVNQVPPETWNWKCVNDHPNTGDVKVCGVCQAKPGTREGPLSIACTKCGAAINVPTTVAHQKAVATVVGTQRLATDTVDKTKDTYTYLSSAPVQFNCSTCNIKLNVPPPAAWTCQTANCGVANVADVSVCSQCKIKNKLMVRCGACQQPTQVPDSNLSNEFRATKLSAQAKYKSVKETAVFVSQNKDEIKAAAELAKEHPELVQAASEASQSQKEETKS